MQHLVFAVSGKQFLLDHQQVHAPVAVEVIANHRAAILLQPDRHREPDIGKLQPAAVHQQRIE